jgi:epoxyqueuosine reductase
VNSRAVKALAQECGFELAGVTPAAPAPEAEYYQRWVAQGFAGQMNYLTDRRADVRNDPRNLLPSARSVICVGKLYNGPQPYSTKFQEPELGWISRYAWGEDYHDVLRRGLERLVEKLLAIQPFEYKICVDTAPLLERTYARQAGLGWIGKNTCLINQQMGSWFFLGELLLSIDMEPDTPPPDRCGTCTRCIDACPTAALIPHEDRLCARFKTLHLLLHHRVARIGPSRSPRGNRKPCLRLRHLSRCVPLEYKESRRLRIHLCAPAVRAAARNTRQFDRGGISRDVPRVSHPAIEI